MSRSFRNNRIRAQFHIATPMFLGGANHEAARIRGSSVKGALAFWWRAFHFAHHVQEPGRNVDDALKALRDREKRLFGSSDGGQGRFLLRVRHGEMKQHPSGEVLKNGSSDLGTGARYLGYGLMGAFGKDAGRLQRSCLVEGQSFTVELLFRPGSTDDDRREMGVALKLLGLLGGLGSRVRRGWGSVALIRMDGAGQDWQAPGSREDYVKTLKALFENHSCRGLSGAEWPLTAFAKESGVWVSGEPSSNSLDMLDRLGRAMLNYRGMGRGADREVGKQPILKQFREDHDWFRKGAGDVDIPYRSAFGLPHMYDSKQGIGVVPESSDRRASPLMFHVHKAGPDVFGTTILLPTKFLDGKIVAKRDKERETIRTYILGDPYCTRKASGLDVLKDFLGAGSGKFQKNEVVAFEQVLP